MKKIHFKVLLLIGIAAVSFLAGSWITFQGVGKKATAERKILHYVDPMNPALKSDKPGMATCGMPLEPVYADQGDDAAGSAALRASLPPGTIRIAPEKQQLIGVKTVTVEKAPWNHTLRVLGRVAPDETRTYRINAAANGWIEQVRPVTTGSLVKENEILATFYSLEYRPLVQNYVNLIKSTRAMSPVDKAAAQPPRYSTGQLKQLREASLAIGQSTEQAQVEYYRRNLFNYGISPGQVEEMERTGEIPDSVQIRAPISGFILYRNVSPGLRFDRGAEFFRIADLSRVWILADIFETEAAHFKAGVKVRMELPYQKKILYGKVSSVLPQFDSATRTLKVRLEAANPGYVMRPDMFVNVDLPASGPPAIIVPMDAVLDSGLKKTVFVDQGSGFFEPRQVETGHMLGDRVEIVRGLEPGEKIVVSGNFLIDSEARMQLAASGITGKIGRDPVCGMNIDEDRARTAGLVSEFKGKGYFFCSPECRDDFAKNPERYLKALPAPGAMPASGSRETAAEHASHGSAPAAASKPRGAKAMAPEAHDGMAMPAEKPSLAMPGMPAPPPKSPAKREAMPMSMPKGEKVAAPEARDGVAMPGMAVPQAQSPAKAGGGPMSMPTQTPSLAVPAMPLPAPQSPTKTRGMLILMPSEGAQAEPTAQEGAPGPGMQEDEMAPPAPAASPRRANPRYQRYFNPGTGSQAGPQGAAPAPGSRVRKGIPPAEGPQVMNLESPPLPLPESTPAPGQREAAPMKGTKAGVPLLPAPGAPGVKQ